MSRLPILFECVIKRVGLSSQAPSGFLQSDRQRPSRSIVVYRLQSTAPGLIAGILIGVLIVVAQDQRRPGRPAAGLAPASTDVDKLPPDEVRALILEALSNLDYPQKLNRDRANGNQDFDKRAVGSHREARQGIDNMRRLLPPAQRWVIESLRDAASSYDLKPPEWNSVIHLIHGVHKIVRSPSQQAAAEVRQNRLSEILVGSGYAPYLVSDDEATFVLGHELMHVAARSGSLNRFIDGVAVKANHLSNVKPTENQKEDLACDFMGELVLKRFIGLNPTNEAPAIRVSRVLGYESPAERFARAWDDFCASYEGDPGDREHLTQYETIRALSALDPELQAMMPEPASFFSKPRGISQ